MLKKNKDEEVCGFCGPYEKCNEKYHTQQHLRNLLVDAGIIADNDQDFTKWWLDKHKDIDPEWLLMGHTPADFWNAGYKYPKKLANFIRSIL